MLPLALPADCGANCTIIVTLCEGDSVTDKPAPLAENPAPLTMICEIVTFELPVFEIDTFCDVELPVVTLRKPKLVGLTDSVRVASTPTPLNTSVDGEFGALLTSERLPLTLPAACGANCTMKLVLCSAAMTSGTEIPLVLKPLPVTVACEMVRFVLPVFVI